MQALYFMEIMSDFAAFFQQNARLRRNFAADCMFSDKDASLFSRDVKRNKTIEIETNNQQRF